MLGHLRNNLRKALGGGSKKTTQKQNFRQTMKSTTAMVLFGAIVIVFVFWGMNPASRSLGAGGPAAVVNNAHISQVDLARAIDMMRQDPRVRDAEQQKIAAEALERLVMDEVFKQETNSAGVVVSDDEVREQITQIPVFQKDGQFDLMTYRGILAANRLSPEIVEDDVRNRAAKLRMRRLFIAANRPVSLEATQKETLKNLKANLEFLRIRSDDLAAKEKISTEEQAQFEKAPGTEERLKSYYTNNKSKYETPEMVKVRHILVRVEPGKPEAESKAKLDRVLKKLKAGTDFGKVAKEESDDPGSKSNGGVIDFFPKGQMVPEFEKAAFEMPKGKTSEPIKTQFGYHIVQVMDKKAAVNKSFEQARTEIVTTLVSREKLAKQISELEAQVAKGDLPAVEKFASAHGIKWEDTGPFAVDAASIPKIGVNDQAMKEAFSLTSVAPLAKTTIRQGPEQFVLRYKAVSPAGKASPAEDPMAALMGGSGFMAKFLEERRADEAMNSWFEGLRTRAKVSVNAALLRGEASDGGPPPSF